MAFFDSDIVQDEAKRLFSDYQQLMQLGSEYGKFDREGKKKFIETMEEPRACHHRTKCPGGCREGEQQRAHSAGGSFGHGGVPLPPEATVAA